MASTAPEATVNATSSRSRTDWRSRLLAVVGPDRMSNLIGASGDMFSPWDLLAMTAACRLGVEMSSRLSHIRSPCQPEHPVPASVGGERWLTGTQLSALLPKSLFLQSDSLGRIALFFGDRCP